MRPVLTILFLVFFSLEVSGQANDCTFSINGKVLDKDTREPIPSVTVNIRGTKKFTTTNSKGEFVFKGLCTENHTLILSHFAYRNVAHVHDHKNDKTANILLTPEILELESITVQAEKQKEQGTESISQITVEKAEIKRDATQSFAATLVRVPGVTLTSTGTNVQLPVIHGLNGNRILILNNGLKHGFQNWGSDHAPEIDITSIDNITVVKGASGVRFGPEALGGAIVVESNPLNLRNPLYAEIGTGFQHNGAGYNTNIELGQGFDKWSYFLNGNFTTIGDKSSPDYVLSNSGKREQSLGFGTRYYNEKWDIKTYYSYVNQNLALLRTAVAGSADSFIRAFNTDEPVFVRPFSRTINEPNQAVQHHLAKVETNRWYANDSQLTLRFGVQLNKREEFDVRRNADRPIIDLSLLTSDIQIEWKHPQTSGFDGLIGVQLFSQNNDNNPGTSTTPFIPNYNTYRASVFILENLKRASHTLEIGARFDFENNDVRGRETSQALFSDNYTFTNFTLSLGLVREFSNNSTFRTNLSSAWRTPNLAELYSFGQQGFRSTFGLLRYETNNEGRLRTDRVLSLDESSVDAERGFKWINEWELSSDKNAFTITGYANYIQNFIFDRPAAVVGAIRGPSPVFIIDQVDAILLGVDYSWMRAWSTQVSGIFGFSYLWSRSVDRNEPLINQPPISVDYTLDWNLGSIGILESSSISVRPSYTFRQFQAPRTIPPETLINNPTLITLDSEIFDFADAPDGYFLLDASWTFGWKNIRGGVSVNNLLNTSYRSYLNEYRYFADEPGINVLFNLNYQFNNLR